MVRIAAMLRPGVRRNIRFGKRIPVGCWAIIHKVNVSSATSWLLKRRRRRPGSVEVTLAASAERRHGTQECVRYFW